MQIPFVDLKSQYASIKNRILPELEEVLETSAFILGPKVAAFEEKFASMHGVRRCLGVNNGTAALHVALWALGLGPGDEVILPVNTFFATAEAVSMTGAAPRFVEPHPHTYNLDPEAIEAAINPRTKGIVPVHLYGQPADMEPILQIAERRGLWVVEDAAQAHLARYRNKPVGGFGIAACFSFYPGKNLGAYGEAGAIVTNDEDLYHRMRLIRDHGSAEKYRHEMIGHNYRMAGFQGAVLGVKCAFIEEWTRLRAMHAAAYTRLLGDIPQVSLPFEMAEVVHAYHLYVIRVPFRDELAEYLKQRGIATGMHYPIPLHLQPAYAFMGHGPGSFPIAERYAGQILSLPIFPELEEAQIQYVADHIRSFFAQKNSDPKRYE